MMDGLKAAVRRTYGETDAWSKEKHSESLVGWALAPGSGLPSFGHLPLLGSHP